MQKVSACGLFPISVWKLSGALCPYLCGSLFHAALWEQPVLCANRRFSWGSTWDASSSQYNGFAGAYTYSIALSGWN